VVSEILKSRPHPEQGYRACLGLIRLGRRYGDDRLEAACARAERLRSYSYRTVKNILASAQDRLPLEDESVTPAPGSSHENIRGGEYYAAKEESQC
jgi:transposase